MNRCHDQLLVSIDCPPGNPRPSSRRAAVIDWLYLIGAALAEALTNL
jgi:hypothetical protein